MEKRNKKGQFLKGTHWRIEQEFRNKDWLMEEYVTKQRSTMEIANQFGVTDGAILFWLKKHKIKRRTVSESRKVKYWGASGADNPMWNKIGELNPNWKGGVTPERASFYVSQEWKFACSEVWKRDNATCQRCNMHKSESEDIPFHIHHIKSFKHKELRADTNNLVLVCEICHHWIHSNNNTNRDFIKED